MIYRNKARMRVQNRPNSECTRSGKPIHCRQSLLLRLGVFMTFCAFVVMGCGSGEGKESEPVKKESGEAPENKAVSASNRRMNRARRLVRYSEDKPVFGVMVHGAHVYVLKSRGDVEILHEAEDGTLTLAGAYSIAGSESMNAGSIVANRGYVATDAGLLIYDLSQPARPEQIGELKMPGGLSSVAVKGKYAFLHGPQCGLCVVDVSAPASPKIDAVLWIGVGSDAPTTDALRISADLAAVRERSGNWQILNISDPTKPQPLVKLSDHLSYLLGEGTPTRGDLCLAGRYGYLVTSLSEGLLERERKGTEMLYDESLVWVLDFSRPEYPLPVSRLKVPCWVRQMEARDNRLYMDTELGIQTYDISDRAHPVILGEHDVPRRIPDKARIEIASRAAYIPGRGLTVLDLSREPDLHLVAAMEVGPLTGEVVISGNYVYALEEDALAIIDCRYPINPMEVARIPMPGAVSLAVSGATCCLASEEKITVVDVQNPSHPHLLGERERKASTCPSLYLKDNLLYVPSLLAVAIYDISKPADIRYLGHTPSETEEYGRGRMRLCAIGHYLYVCGARTKIFDVGDPAQPIPVVQYTAQPEGTLHERAHDLSLCGDRLAYIVGPDAVVADVSNPAIPRTLLRFAPRESYSADRVFVDGNNLVAYHQGGGGGFRVFNIADLNNVRIVNQLSCRGDSVAFSPGLYLEACVGRRRGERGKNDLLLFYAGTRGASKDLYEWEKIKVPSPQELARRDAALELWEKCRDNMRFIAGALILAQAGGAKIEKLSDLVRLGYVREDDLERFVCPATKDRVKSIEDVDIKSSYVFVWGKGIVTADERGSTEPLWLYEKGWHNHHLAKGVGRFETISFSRAAEWVTEEQAVSRLPRIVPGLGTSREDPKALVEKFEKAEIVPDERIVIVLARLAEQGNRDAIGALGWLRDPEGVPALVKCLNNQEFPIREGAAKALAAIGSSAVGAVEALGAVLADEWPHVGVEAAKALGRIGDKSAVPYLMNAMLGKAPKVRMSSYSYSDVRRACAGALVDIGDTSIIPQLEPFAKTLYAPNLDMAARNIAASRALNGLRKKALQ